MTKLRPYSEFFFLCAVSLVAGWHILASTFALAWGNESYTQILLILPVSASLVLMDWRDTGRMVVRHSRAGSALLIIALVIGGCARWLSVPTDVRLSIGMLALVLWWVGAFVFCGGIPVARKMIFPLCFLLWMVPFPAVLFHSVIRLLQEGSAVCARWLLEGAAVPVAQDGLKLTIPGLTVEVAEECSSIRSSLMLLITTMVLAQLLVRSPWSRTLLVAFAVPLSVAKNGLRIFTIAMLGTRVDPGYLAGRLHHHGGVLFFAIALAVVFLLIWALRHVEDKATRMTQIV
ncbi:MAG TPA: exosortase/archaeosortase family protein [Terriglobales bacterium]|nr:exosortase/archaeosortase family protein [Terriglobales bacterium]